MLGNSIILGALGICFGVTVAGGVFAFITMLDVVPRLAHRTGTATHIYMYENVVIVGGTAGNLWILFCDRMPVTGIGLAMYGLFAGVFVGCLAMALAENLRVMPIFAKRLAIQQGIAFLVLAIALGKMAGTIFQYFY